MPVSQGEQILHGLLSARGIDPTAPRSISETWETFKEFAVIPFDTPSDGVLYQVGIFEFYGRAEFYIDFLRQFEVVDDLTEHDHYEQLHCEFRFPANDESRSYGSIERWWFADSEEPWREFVAIVENRSEFRALYGAPPQGVSIKQQPV